MNSQMNALVEQLKDAGEDFEFYPTTKAMVRAIWKHATEHGNYDHQVHWDLLDIGCGTCNFRRWINELNKEEIDKHPNIREHAEVRISAYYVMEKSRVLLERLVSDTIVIGTDFNESTLIDKECDTVFCNPPYSEYETWTRRIIKESCCKHIYLIIPDRWKKNEEIKHALEKAKAVYEVIGHSDFHNAERAARAKVDIVYISKVNSGEDAGFNTFFDEVFGMSDEKKKRDYEVHEYEFQKLKTELATGKNKVEILCDGYDRARDELFHHFKTISALDADVLKSVGVFKDTVKSALKSKIAGLKNVYWEAAFDCLDEITSRLTSTSRRSILENFRAFKTVDFTASNLYAMIIWVIKNYNKYTESQMLDLFYGLSSPENVKNYVSNKRAFEEYRYRCGRDAPPSTHYTLDYRIIATTYALPGDGFDSSWNPDVQEIAEQKIRDVCAVAYSLGFKKTHMYCPHSFGQLGRVYYGEDDKVMFEFRLYQNRNLHLKFNIELMKAFNVAVGQKLGWIRKPEDIKAEFSPQMAAGAEKYFNCFNACQIDISKAATLLLPA